MADTNWTPGPWSVEDPMDFELAIVEANKPTYEWRFIATCSLPDGDDDQAFTGREVHANAHLIAAAPELYEALAGLCRDLIIRAGGDPDGTNEGVVVEASCGRWIKAQDALAKARGEQVSA